MIYSNRRCSRDRRSSLSLIPPSCSWDPSILPSTPLQHKGVGVRTSPVPISTPDIARQMKLDKIKQIDQELQNNQTTAKSLADHFTKCFYQSPSSVIDECSSINSQFYTNWAHNLVEESNRLEQEKATILAGL